jgi:glycosyltransferase involved in cell wall biosynthesis
MNTMNDRILVLIPCYNEEQTIEKVIADLRRVAPEFDRVVVNDGSEDSTADIIAKLGERQLSLSCNLGYGLALQTGFRYALNRAYDFVVSIDGDGQHRPEDLPRLVNALRNSDSDLIIGSRFCDGRSYEGPLGRRIGQVLFSHLTQLLVGQRIYDTTSGFKALRAEACEAILRGTFLDFHTESLIRLCLLGYKVSEIPVTVDSRTSGHSMYSFLKGLIYPFKTLLLTIVAITDAFMSRRIK